MMGRYVTETVTSLKVQAGHMSVTKAAANSASRRRDFKATGGGAERTRRNLEISQVLLRSDESTFRTVLVTFATSELWAGMPNTPTEVEQKY
jgi:hypothetical protein